MYFRIPSLPEHERAIFRDFYKTYIIDEVLREDLGESFVQAYEFCSTTNTLDKFPDELISNLKKICYFYNSNDPRAIAIKQFLEALVENLDCLKYLTDFFQLELQNLLNILDNYENRLEKFQPILQQFRNNSFDNIIDAFGSILIELEKILEFLIAQLKCTRFSGWYREDKDKVFEKKLINLIDIFSGICLEALIVSQNFLYQSEAKRIFNIIERLLQSSLIVRHPVDNKMKCGKNVIFYKYVLKTNSNHKFQVSCFAPRLLSEIKNLSVKAMLVSEKNSEHCFNNPETFNPDEMCISKPKNHIIEFKEDSSMKILTANFEKFSFENVVRSERRCNDIVTDEKVVFLFHLKFTFQCREILAYGRSNPVVIIVHVNQDSGGHGTMNWHNSLTKYGRIIPTPDSADFSEIAKILNDKFFYTTGRGLSLENLISISKEVLNNDGPVEMRRFLKGILGYIVHDKHEKDETKQKSYSYWDWFYECNKMTMNNFTSTWKKGLIVGFISRRVAEQEVQASPILGTFMIRFSQTMVGSLSLVNNYGMAPFFFSNHFKDKNLEQCVLAYVDLTTLYPNIPKHEVFHDNSSHTCSSINSGYAKADQQFRITRIDWSQARSPTSSVGFTSSNIMSPADSSVLQSGSSYSPTHGLVTNFESLNVIPSSDSIAPIQSASNYSSTQNSVSAFTSSNVVMSSNGSGGSGDSNMLHSSCQSYSPTIADHSISPFSSHHMNGSHQTFTNSQNNSSSAERFSSNIFQNNPNQVFSSSHSNYHHQFHEYIEQPVQNYTQFISHQHSPSQIYRQQYQQDSYSMMNNQMNYNHTNSLPSFHSEFGHNSFRYNRQMNQLNQFN